MDQTTNGWGIIRLLRSTSGWSLLTAQAQGQRLSDLVELYFAEVLSRQSLLIEDERRRQAKTRAPDGTPTNVYAVKVSILGSH